MHRLSALRARTDLWIAPPVLGKYVQIGVPLLPEVSAAWRPTSSSVHGQSENLDSVLTLVRGVGVRRFSFLGSCVRPYRCATYVTLRGACVGSDELERCKDPWLAMREQTLTLLLVPSHQPAGFLED